MVHTLTDAIGGVNFITDIDYTNYSINGFSCNKSRLQYYKLPMMDGFNFKGLQTIVRQIVKTKGHELTVQKITSELEWTKWLVI